MQSAYLSVIKNLCIMRNLVFIWALCMGITSACGLNDYNTNRLELSLIYRMKIF